ncbi:MAG: L-threonylcarbamoyladenylate synthase [Syntrophomonas sp.]|nr:L-threonylcarbamoyladenylate synthase [Syntrophomonas sp.]MDD2509527.1 L-threonylcarbamoyladenylate synthase [Syntrophomonas sp.]MDD3878398.1 L-threonylcarbamoyladenylate synthase [Syntrophomonas sp.]MDD4625503.1 L-threonylcarbamoyladenylate synthase [Syntrophomonas sp.]
MKTQYWQVNPTCPEKEIIIKAANLIKAQELVAFPTETVYGLGAAAFQTQAVEKIFMAKGRPEANPLLLHLSRMEQVESVAKEIPPVAEMLMERFWPGPLSIILSARETVPAIVRGGKTTVGLRMPAHPVALALIDQTGPLAAPSANLSGRPSPVNAEDVKADLDGKIAAVLDAGRTGLGLESTIIDFTSRGCRILRQGGITVEELEEATGMAIAINDRGQEQYHHYQTNSQLLLCQTWEEIENSLADIKHAKKKLALVYTYVEKKNARWESLKDKYPQHQSYDLDISSASNRLYSLLREAEEREFELLLFTPLPEKPGGIGRVILDRIYQAARGSSK